MDDAQRDVAPSAPSLAGVYDHIVGGTDNTRTDRLAVADFNARWPGVAANGVANAALLQRVVKYLAEQGIHQIIDLGSGKPKPDVGTNVHELLSAHAGDGRVVYVEKDPTAHSHARAIWGSGAGTASRTAYLEADVRDADYVLSEIRDRNLLDLDEPVGVLMLAVLHYVDLPPAEVVAPYADAVAPGSHLAITHMAPEGTPQELLDALQVVFAPTGGVYIRTRNEIKEAFQGWPLVGEAELVDVRDWRPDEPVEKGPLPLLAGVARKP